MGVHKTKFEAMKKVVLWLGLVVFLAVSCSNKEHEQEPEVANVNFTPCQQTKAKSAESTGEVDVEFTNEGVKITHFDFEVTCDFSAVNVTHTFVNGVLNIIQQSSPNKADCICYTDVSYTIIGISQSEVNVIFINDEQVYCHNDKGNGDEDDIPRVILCCATFGELPATNQITSPRIEGDYLKMTICSSGCDGSSWVVKLFACPNDATIYPPLIDLRISFENYETCAAVPCREFSFNIENLQMQGTNKVQLNVLGNSILYEYD